MFRQMRRLRQQLSKEVCEAMLASVKSGVLAVNGEDGYPYAVPMNFAFSEGALYFHSAVRGHKIDALAKDPKACFTVTGYEKILPEALATRYTSVIAFGHVEAVSDEAEKLRALLLISRKYSPGFMEKAEAVSKKMLSGITVLRMQIDDLKGKESLDMTKAKEAALE